MTFFMNGLSNHLLFDELPYDASHLISVHLHHRLVHLDALCGIWNIYSHINNDINDTLTWIDLPVQWSVIQQHRCKVKTLIPIAGLVSIRRYFESLLEFLLADVRPSLVWVRSL